MESTSCDLGGAALITGASRGLGKVIAQRLATAGYHVAVNFRRSRAEAEEIVRALRARGAKASCYQADMSDPIQAQDLVARAEREIGPLRVVVSNAGITRDRLLVQMSEDDWDATWQTNLAGPRALCEAALSVLMPRGAGRVITVSSVVGTTGNAGQSNYAAAKSGLQGLTRALAVRAAPSGVTVNCVAPGYFATDATSQLTDDQKAVWFRQIPMGREGCPEDVAELVYFLTSAEAGYITGQCIAIDGGFLAGAGFTS